MKFIEPPFEGTRYGITVYKLKSGRWFGRKKSSLTARRVKKDPAFKPLMADAGLMKIASPLASQIYRQLPADKRKVQLYRQMVAVAKGLLKEGNDETSVREALIYRFMTPEKSNNQLFKVFNKTAVVRRKPAIFREFFYMSEINQIEKVGGAAVRKLRLKKLQSGLPFMINSKDLPANHCYLEYPDGMIRQGSLHYVDPSTVQADYYKIRRN
jgi:hypothetical protein